MLGTRTQSGNLEGADESTELWQYRMCLIIAGTNYDSCLIYRFQRHIALNAHFQNEHIGQSSSAADSDKKICRLCSHVSSDMAAVRQHLVKQHNIDLENPASSLVEPEPSTTTTYNGDLIISRRSSPVTITTDANVELITSSSSSTPDRTSPVLGPVKIELIDDVEQEHAKDLSIRSHKQQQQQQQPEVVQVHRKRPASPAAVSVKLIKKAQKNSRAGHNDNHESDSNWQCQHCNITFPNQTLYFLHRGFHSETDPWRCNGCGLKCSDLYDFNTHLVSDPHRWMWNCDRSISHNNLKNEIFIFSKFE